MAKISELPQLANPAGTELVPVVGADGATKAARIGGLVDGAVARLVVAIGIEPVRAGWQEVVVDSNNRVVSGYHPVLSNYDGGRSALERRILVLEGGGEGVETIARKGGWITCTVDVNGRVVRGKHVLFGNYPAQDVETGGGNAAWAAKIAELRGLRLRDAAALLEPRRCEGRLRDAVQCRRHRVAGQPTLRAGERWRGRGARAPG